jgi:hypothetical protein
MLDTEKLKSLRNSIYNNFPARRDANMNLLDALSSYGHRCKAVVELSESPYFERQYSSITDGIADGLTKAKWSQIMKDVYTTTQGQQDRVLFITDCTPNPRASAKAVADRSITHSPNPAPGNKPICEGHQYSVVAMIPECSEAQEKHWLVPLSTERVPSNKKGNEVGMHQIKNCIEHLELDDKFVISIGDSLYGTPACREIVAEKENWAHLFRLNSTRNIYAPADNSEHASGNKKRYGDVMKLNNDVTHSKPDETDQKTIVTRRGKKHTVTIQLWRDRIFRGSTQFKGYEHPITLLKMTITDETGKPVYKHPLWLGIAGKRRNEITATEAYDYYAGRYDIEYFFRFGKNNLLMDVYQTPDVAHEEDWWRLGTLAYTQLYLARKDLMLLPKKWERYLPSYQAEGGTAKIATPSQAQRAFYRVLDAIKTPAKECRQRGNPKGRKKGETQPKRKRHKTIFKTKKKENKQAETIISEPEKSTKISGLLIIDDLINSVHASLQKFDCSPEEFYKRLKNAA